MRSFRTVALFWQIRLSKMENPTLFVVILRYIVPIEIIIEQRDEHVIFLDKYYAKGIFHASGPQIPRYGGMILAKASSREELNRILGRRSLFPIQICRVPGY